MNVFLNDFFFSSPELLPWIFMEKTLILVSAMHKGPLASNPRAGES